jgi:hypothetical protein
MPGLTRRGKRLLPVDLEDEEDGLGNINTVGILAQRAARREVAREQEAARAQEPPDNQVRTFIVSYLIYHDMSQDDNAQPPTPPRSSPVSSSPARQRRNSSPAAQRRRSRSSSLYLTPSPRPQRTPLQSLNARPATSSPTRVPLAASGRLNLPRAEGNAQRRQPIQQHAPQPPNTTASSSQVSGREAPPPPATTSTSQTKRKKTAPAGKRRKKYV